MTTIANVLTKKHQKGYNICKWGGVMTQTNKEFSKMVQQNLDSNSVLKQLSKKQQSKQIVSAIGVMQTAVFVNVLKDFEKHGKTVDLDGLALQNDLTSTVYKKIVVAMKNANKILGKSNQRNAHLGQELAF